jgi:hypothetical protein
LSEPLYRNSTSKKIRSSEVEVEEVIDDLILRPTKIKVPVVGHRRWINPILWVILGFLLSLFVVGGLVWWLIGSSPARITPPPANNPAAASDLNVRVGQDYINREISRALQENPLNAFGVASISDLKVAFEPSSQMSVTVRLNALGRDFDFNFKDSVAAVNQKVVLTQAGDVQLAMLGLPLSALNEVVKQVNTLVEDEINKQVGAGQPGDCITCTNLGRVPTLKSLTTEPGSLVAQFDIAIK